MRARFVVLPILLALIVSLLVPLGPGGAGLLTVREAKAADNPFHVEMGSATIPAGGRGNVEILVVVPEGHHVYRDMMDVAVPEPGLFKPGKARFPKGIMEDDPATPGMTREIFHESVHIALPISVPATMKPGSYELAVEVAYQGCKSNLCFMPRRDTLSAAIKVTEAVAKAAVPEAAPARTDDAGAEPAADAAVAPPDPSKADVAFVPAPIVPVAGFPPPPALPEKPVAAPPPATAGAFDTALARGGFWLLIFVFGAGFLVSLTPCVLPMVPVTMGVIGVQSGGGRLRGLTLTLAYVLGLVLVYTSLGVTAALTGSMFGAWMQSPWVVGAVAIFFFAMGLAMFGVFDVAAPGALTNRLSRVSGSGLVGAFVFGMVGALVAGPCSGPVIASLMVFIGQQGRVAEGALLMGVFSLGMGVIFIVAGVFSSTLFRPGPWMETIRQAFGVLMWLAAIWFVQAHLPPAVVRALAAIVLLGTAVFGWPRPGQEEEEGWTIVKIKRLYGIVAGIVGAWLLLALLGLPTNGAPVENRDASAGAERGAAVAWLSSEPEALLEARNAGRPVIVDFGAEWCAACKELEHKTYTDPQVASLARGFVMLKIDATSGSDPEVKRLVEKYHVSGLPSVFFLKPDGSQISELTLTGFEEAPLFAARMKTALGVVGR
jgi:thioredoxin:protein disulfide reductase